MTPRLIIWLLAATTLTGTVHGDQQAQQQPNRIPVSVAVDSEGPEGLWAQSAVDLSKLQLQELGNLMKAEISKQKDIRLVETKDPRDHVHVAVVAAKVECSGRRWFLASSVVSIATAKGEDIFVTHDVIAGTDLASVARSTSFYLASIKIRLALRIVR